jgi:hypothetical protein
MPDETRHPDQPFGGITNKLLLLLRSRKFWAAVVGIVVVAVGDRAGIDGDTLTKAVATIAAYILGTALEDGLRGVNGK